LIRLDGGLVRRCANAGQVRHLNGEWEAFPNKDRRETTMPKYVIEREIPGAGNMTPEQLQAASQTSCGVLQKMGTQIQWQQSYVTGDKLYCIYIAPNEDMIREHAQQGGFPANRISEVKTIIDPTTAEA
jgi:hypothetical protein